jgi:hypothetical protein
MIRYMDWDSSRRLYDSFRGVDMRVQHIPINDLLARFRKLRCADASRALLSKRQAIDAGWGQ